MSVISAGEAVPVKVFRLATSMTAPAAQTAAFMLMRPGSVASPGVPLRIFCCAALSKVEVDSAFRAALTDGQRSVASCWGVGTVSGMGAEVQPANATQTAARA